MGKPTAEYIRKHGRRVRLEHATYALLPMPFTATSEGIEGAWFQLTGQHTDATRGAYVLEHLCGPENVCLQVHHGCVHAAVRVD